MALAHLAMIQKVSEYEQEMTGSAVRWLSGRVLDSKPRGAGLEPNRRHCVVVLEQDNLSQLSTGSTQEDLSLFN